MGPVFICVKLSAWRQDHKFCNINLNFWALSCAYIVSTFIVSITLKFATLQKWIHSVVKKTQHSSRKTCALVPNTVCVIICYLYHHSDSLWERHGCVHSVVSRCTLTIPFTSNTLLPIKTIIIPGLLQAPKISVTQLSAPLCSAAGKALSHSPTFYTDSAPLSLKAGD